MLAVLHDNARLSTTVERLVLTLTFVLAIGCDAGSDDDDGGLPVDSGPRTLMDAVRQGTARWVNAGSISFAEQSAPAVDLEGRARDASPDVGAMELQP